ncbi:MAG: hypothetical protein VKO65_08900 [Cyanobacteriota bacterium]|nr:hypothetical protein [Cyanobacteriota bacterium]
MKTISPRCPIGPAAAAFRQSSARPHACSLKARPLPGTPTPPTWEELLGRR